MRAFAVVTFLISALTAQFAAAQIKSFPYDAKVVVDEVFVRCGAGDSYYPTQKLPRETVVTVHRHDPGGWYMIDPPPGSFSWIPERYVKRVNEAEGEVAEESVIAFVGSEFGDEASVFQRRLKTGEKISIIGQRQIATSSGSQLSTNGAGDGSSLNGSNKIFRLELVLLCQNHALSQPSHGIDRIRNDITIARRGST